MEFDNIETVKRAVEIDAGVSIVPQGTVTQEVAKQTLAAVPIEDGDVLPAARRHDLQEEQGAVAGDETVPDDPQGRDLEVISGSTDSTASNPSGINTPSLRMSSPSNQTSPPPHSLRWINTMSQCTASGCRCRTPRRPGPA
jgi:hypothetical protein